MSKRPSRKGMKAARRQRELKEKTRRPRANVERQDTPGKALEHAYIDPVSLVMVRDLHKNTQIFWKHATTYPDHMRNLSADSHTGRRVLSGEEAQAALEPLIEGMLKSIRDLVEKYEALRWLVLIRPNLCKFLGEFMDGKGYAGLSQQDRLGVLAMLELAATEYGQREDYFAAHGQVEIEPGQSPQELVERLPPIPAEEIVALRDLLHRVVVLYGLEKSFRVSGRGVGIAIKEDGKIVLVTPESINDGFLLYDRRVQAQQESGQILVAAGFPGFARLEGASPEQLFVMGRLNSAAFSAFMNELRRHDSSECNPMNFCPASLDTSDALEFLRQMPEGTARKTGGLSPHEVVVCFQALSRIGIVAFNDRATRYWLGCYGLLPLAAMEFAKRFNVHLKEGLPNCSDKKIDELRDKFVKTFSLPQRQGHTEFDRSNVHRYMTDSSAFFRFDQKKSVLIDYLGLPNHLNSWLVSLRLDGFGRGDIKRGVLFEKWLCSELEACVKGSSSETKPMPEQGLDVKVEPKKTHTDIDVVLPIPPWLLVISCKNYEMKDGEFRGVAQVVSNRWTQLYDDLKQWDDKMRRLFLNERYDWRILNPRLAEIAEDCSFVLPILVTPRVEWIPALTPELCLRPGSLDGEGVTAFPIPRIGTLDDLKRMFLMGGPKPVQPDWVINI